MDNRQSQYLVALANQGDGSTSKAPDATYSNAGGKRWHLTAGNGTRRIQSAISELAAPIC